MKAPTSKSRIRSVEKKNLTASTVYLVRNWAKGGMKGDEEAGRKRLQVESKSVTITAKE